MCELSVSFRSCGCICSIYLIKDNDEHILMRPPLVVTEKLTVQKYPISCATYNQLKYGTYRIVMDLIFIILRVN